MEFWKQLTELYPPTKTTFRTLHGTCYRINRLFNYYRLQIDYSKLEDYLTNLQLVDEPLSYYYLEGLKDSLPHFASKAPNQTDKYKSSLETKEFLNRFNLASRHQWIAELYTTNISRSLLAVASVNNITQPENDGAYISGAILLL